MYSCSRRFVFVDVVRWLAYELGELRAQYQEEVAMMRIVCHDALVAAEQMGLNTGVLQREAVALAEQENKVVAITDHMERKESHYREKGESHCFVSPTNITNVSRSYERA